MGRGAQSRAVPAPLHCHCQLSYWQCCRAVNASPQLASPHLSRAFRNPSGPSCSDHADRGGIRGKRPAASYSCPTASPRLFLRSTSVFSPHVCTCIPIFEGMVLENRLVKLSLDAEHLTSEVIESDKGRARLNRRGKRCQPIPACNYHAMNASLCPA